LLHALRCLGQDAAGIIPAGMEVIFQTPTTTPQDIPGQLVTRCEQGMSKAILGGTLTTQADGKTSTNALGTIHNEVRRDLLAADAMQLAATLTSQLLAPLCLLNLGITDRKLLPYWRFDTQEAGDLALYADALPKLAPYMKISRQFVHERLKLPVALDEDDVFRAEGQDGDGSDDRPGRQNATTHLTAPVGGDGKEDGEETGAGQDALDKMCDSADAALAEAAGALLGPLFAEVAAGLPPEALEKRLADLYPAMDATQLTDILSRLLFVAQLEGRSHEDPH
ncbi:phage portal protein family protein, partial [Desulfovibrio sp.]